MTTGADKKEIAFGWYKVTGPDLETELTVFVSHGRVVSASGKIEQVLPFGTPRPKGLRTIRPFDDSLLVGAKVVELSEDWRWEPLK